MNNSQTLINFRIDKKLIEKILKIYWVNCKLISLKPCNRAYMNKVFEIQLVNPNCIYIIKISNQPKKFGLEKEKKIRDIIAKKTSIPVPKIIKFDFSKKVFPFKYLILEKIDGHLLEDIWGKLSKKEKEQIAYKSGEILAKLHTIKFKSFGDPITNKRFNSVYSQIIKANKEIRTIFKKENLLEPIIIEKIKCIIKGSKRLLTTCKEPTLTHNDFFFWHIFVKKINHEWEINGIIDFGFASSSTKEVDFVKPDRWIFSHGKNIKNKFMKGYTTIQLLNKNHDKIVDLYRIHYDMWFYYRLIKTNQVELAEHYKQEIFRRIKQWKV